MNISYLNTSLFSFGLKNLGGFNLNSKEKNLYGVESIILVGPQEPVFWEKFKDSKEYRLGIEDPLDSWSKRVIGLISTEFKARAFFPFEGPPYMPFYSWAIKTGECFKSPVNLLVHRESGLFVSFRGAIGFEKKIDINKSKKASSPCLACHKPCATSCTVSALTVDGYDVPKCISYISQSEQKDCRSGCLVRRSCPVGKGLRPIEQSKFHMSKFADLS
jgi:epoxyqueuosine reductase